MAFSNIFYDKFKVQKKLEQYENNLKYMVQVPGNGTRPYFINDPQIRLQKFGGNISYNITDLNSNLIGLGSILSNCNDINKIDITRKGNNNLETNFSEKQFPIYKDAITDESRLMMPAWTLRDMEAPNWNNMTHVPIQNFEISFQNNINSRNLEKDRFNKEC